MSNNITQFSKCANCGACQNICPKEAITIDEADYFYKVIVDEDKCINCGACVAVCPLNTLQPHLDLNNAYGGWSNDKEVVKTSSSGGAFTVIADYVLSKNGVVFGAAYTDDCKKVIIRSTDDTCFDNIKRSKYVESLVFDSFKSIRKKLEQGKPVLFCGTPCQVAGLTRYLQKDYEKLITIDFACGGLTSHKMYAEHLESLEKRYHSKVAAVNFRAGLYGWKQHSLKIDFINGKSYKMPSNMDPYVYSFMYSRYGNRDNCYDCKFRDNHYSDFIIADFWKWFDYSNLQNNETGISLILTNSDKGERVLQEISKDMHLEKLDINQAMYNCFVKPPVPDEFFKNRNCFFKDYEENDLKTAAINSGMQHGLKAKINKLRIINSTKRYIR